ncbi:hypothetical protein HanPSC8_Chr03g0128811 [Helianthus annuus]|nr:hypothetical protein HanPSC8_Chr03g0128811 [Helianthus annuus]
MSVSLEIAGMLPMVCYFVTRIVPYSGDYPSNKITNHREHTCYFQKVGTKLKKT